jgi:hypothetical protein
VFASAASRARAYYFLIFLGVRVNIKPSAGYVVLTSDAAAAETRDYCLLRGNRVTVLAVHN